MPNAVRRGIRGPEGCCEILWSTVEDGCNLGPQSDRKIIEHRAKPHEFAIAGRRAKARRAWDSVLRAHGRGTARIRRPGAARKAKTAVLFRAESGALGCKSQPGGPLWSIENSNDGLVTFGGGAPIFDNEHGCIGGVGVSGGSVEQDEEIARTCL